MKTHSVALINPVQARQILTEKVLPYIKACLMANRVMVIKIGPKEDNRTLQQNAYYWGVVLACISNQASINGTGWSVDAWHELFKRQFLGYEIKKVRVAGSKRVRILRRLRSTTGLKVKPMGKYLEQVQAFAATDLGVQFPAPNWMEWAEKNPVISQQENDGEEEGWTPESANDPVVDQETGEIYA